MDMNLRYSKFFTPVMDKIFPLWYNFNIDENSVYLMNAMFRYILIKKYGNEVITKKEDLQKINIGSWVISGSHDADGFRRLCNRDFPFFYLVFCSEDYINTMETMAENFEELNSSAYPINSFIKSGSRKTTRVFVNSEKHQIFACLTGRMTDVWIGRFLSCTSRIWRWVFNEQNTTDDDLALLKALSECDWAKVEEYFNKLAPDYTNDYLKSFLSVYQKSFIDAQISSCNNRANDYRQNISSYMRSLNDNLDKLASVNMQIQSLSLLKNTQTDEVTPFFECHKNITIRDIEQGGGSGTYILYTVNETLEFYDVDEFKRIYNNRRQTYLSDISDKLLNVLYAMFVEDKGHFVVQSEFRLNQLSSITPLTRGNIAGVNYNDVLPHPHLGFFHCLGGNESEIAKAMKSGNWDLAIEQTIAATKNLAFGDNAVMSELMYYLKNNVNTKFILADNGERMSINEFADYIGYKEADNG